MRGARVGTRTPSEMLGSDLLLDPAISDRLGSAKVAPGTSSLDQTSHSA